MITLYLIGAVITFIASYVFWCKYWLDEFGELGPSGTVWAVGPAAIQAFLWPLFVPFYLAGLIVREVLA